MNEKKTIDLSKEPARYIMNIEDYIACIDKTIADLQRLRADVETTRHLRMVREQTFNELAKLLDIETKIADI